MKAQVSVLLFLIGTICAQERSISGGSSRRNRFSAGKPQAVNFNCPEDFGYYPHPHECSQYYVCVFGGALLESCTGGLMYSNDLQTCDWPRNVVCKSSEGPGVSTVKVTDPRTESRDLNSINSATESLAAPSLVTRGLDNTIRTREPLKSSGTSKSIFDDSSKIRQGRFIGNGDSSPQLIDNEFQAQETSSRTFNVVPSSSPKSKISFPPSIPVRSGSNRFTPARATTQAPPLDKAFYSDLLNLNDTDYYYYYDDILYDDYYDSSTKSTTAKPSVRTPVRVASNRHQNHTQNIYPTRTHSNSLNVTTIPPFITSALHNISLPDSSTHTSSNSTPEADALASPSESIPFKILVPSKDEVEAFSDGELDVNKIVEDYGTNKRPQHEIKIGASKDNIEKKFPDATITVDHLKQKSQSSRNGTRSQELSQTLEQASKLLNDTSKNSVKVNNQIDNEPDIPVIEVSETIEDFSNLALSHKKARRSNAKGPSTSFTINRRLNTSFNRGDAVNQRDKLNQWPEHSRVSSAPGRYTSTSPTNGNVSFQRNSNFPTHSFTSSVSDSAGNAPNDRTSSDSARVIVPPVPKRILLRDFPSTTPKKIPSTLISMRSFSASQIPKTSSHSLIPQRVSSNSPLSPRINNGNTENRFNNVVSTSSSKTISNSPFLARPDKARVASSQGVNAVRSPHSSRTSFKSDNVFAESKDNHSHTLRISSNFSKISKTDKEDSTNLIKLSSFNETASERPYTRFDSKRIAISTPQSSKPSAASFTPLRNNYDSPNIFQTPISSTPTETAATKNNSTSQIALKQNSKVNSEHLGRTFTKSISRPKPTLLNASSFTPKTAVSVVKSDDDSEVPRSQSSRPISDNISSLTRSPNDQPNSVLPEMFRNRPNPFIKHLPRNPISQPVPAQQSQSNLSITSPKHFNTRPEQLPRIRSLSRNNHSTQPLTPDSIDQKSQSSRADSDSSTKVGFGNNRRISTLSEIVRDPIMPILIKNQNVNPTIRPLISSSKSSLNNENSPKETSSSLLKPRISENVHVRINLRKQIMQANATNDRNNVSLTEQNLEESNLIENLEANQLSLPKAAVKVKILNSSNSSLYTETDDSNSKQQQPVNSDIVEQKVFSKFLAVPIKQPKNINVISTKLPVVPVVLPASQLTNGISRERDTSTKNVPQNYTKNIDNTASRNMTPENEQKSKPPPATITYSQIRSRLSSLNNTDFSPNIKAEILSNTPNNTTPKTVLKPVLTTRRPIMSPPPTSTRNTPSKSKLPERKDMSESSSIHSPETGLDRGSSRNKPKPSSTSTTSGGIPEVVGRTPQRLIRPSKKPSPSASDSSLNIDIWKYPPRRPDPLYPQPPVDVPAQPCDRNACKLPDCSCGGRFVPGDIPPQNVPQMVLLTFDDSVNDLNKKLYVELFEKGRVNPNGCPISASFYISHEWTDYAQVQNLYSDGHEIASHSITHSFGEQFGFKKWAQEIGGQREIMSAYAGVRMEDIRGMRAPFLAVGGNNMFRMLYDLNFTYDSSMPVYENNPPSWPYTLDYKIFHDCMIPPCPTNSYPGVWQVPMVMWQDLTGGRCSMGDACTTPPDAEGIYKMLIKNFERHYTTNRAPFGLFYHAAWFTTPHHKEGFIAFLDTISAMDDVWLVTNWQALQWVRDPTPLSQAKSFPPFQCDYPERPPRCTSPRVCNVWHKGSVRYMKTCHACPESYPWTGDTGVNSPLNNL